jgi:hypothetical protein
MEMERMGERHLQRRDDCDELLIIMLYITCQIAALCCMYQLFSPQACTPSCTSMAMPALS